MTVRREQHELRLSPLDNRALANLCGPLDANLRQIEAALDVAIAHRGGDFTLTGTAAQTRAEAAEDTSLPLLGTRRTDLHGLTPNQTLYLKHIQEHDITFAI